MSVLHTLRSLFPKRTTKLARRSNRFMGTRYSTPAQQLETRAMLTVDYVQVADSLDAELVELQTRLTSALNAMQTGATSKIPIVGDQLGRAANIVASFRTEMQEAIESFGTTTPTTSSTLTTMPTTTRSAASR